MKIKIIANHTNTQSHSHIVTKECLVERTHEIMHKNNDIKSVYTATYANGNAHMHTMATISRDSVMLSSELIFKKRQAG